MIGQIVKFDARIGAGVIKSEGGDAYRFQSGNIRNPNGKLVGLDVDFELESRQPKDIILLHGSPWAAFGR